MSSVKWRTFGIGINVLTLEVQRDLLTSRRPLWMPQSYPKRWFGILDSQRRFIKHNKTQVQPALST